MGTLTACQLHPLCHWLTLGHGPPLTSPLRHKTVRTVTQWNFLYDFGTKGISCASHVEHRARCEYRRSPGTTRPRCSIRTSTRTCGSGVCALSASAPRGRERHARTPPFRGDCGLQSSVSERAHYACHAGACAHWRSPGGAARAAPTTGISVPVASHAAAARRKKSPAGPSSPTRQCCCHLPPRPRILATSRPGPRTATRHPRTQPALSHASYGPRHPYTSYLYA